jgi:hypothetical protein
VLTGKEIGEEDTMLLPDGRADNKAGETDHQFGCAATLRMLTDGSVVNNVC